jgi:DNA-binding PadR family transcriptional regulator
MLQDRDRVDRFLPLKPLVLDVLLGDRILPANFYRTLRALRDDGLIEEASGDVEADPAERRQYVSLTTLGARVAKAEVKRLEALVIDPRVRKLLKVR